MKILYHHRIRGIDGQAVHVRALIRALLDEGHEVREVALEPVFRDSAAGASSPGTRPNGTGVRSARPWWGIDRLPRPLLELAEDSYSLVARRMLVRAAAAFRPDIIYERYAFGNVGGVLAGRRLGVPLVLEVNAPLVEELAATRGLFLPGVARRLEAMALRRADLVCVVSRVLGRIVVERGARPDRVLAIQNAVDAGRFRPADPVRRAAARRRLGLPEGGNGETLALGFAGFVREWHGLDLVLASLCRPELAGTRLVVVGEGPHSQRLARRAAELGIAGRVTMLGTRPHEEVPEVLAALDVAVISGAPPYASPLKLHEYLGAGLPVVAPNQENLREVLADRENALLFEPGSAEALAAALAELVGDPGLRLRLGARARESVLDEGRTWRGVAQRVAAEASTLVGA